MARCTGFFSLVSLGSGQPRTPRPSATCHDRRVTERGAYRWSAWRFALAMVLIGFAGAAVGWFVLSLLFSALAGDAKLPPLADGVLFVSIYAVFFAIASVVFARKTPPSLKFGEEGIELAAARRDAVRVPYPAVVSAQVRYRWPLSVLHVFVSVVDESQVTPLNRGGREPLRRPDGDRLRFSVPLAGLGASAATVRSELRRRSLP